jgi:polar amino acid transport system substrate-binding protein
MKKVIVTLSLTAALLALPAATMAENLVFTGSEWPPYAMLEKGQITGIQVEIIRSLGKRLGFDVEIQILPWKRALMYVKEGKADAVFAPFRTEEREEYMYFTSEPLLIQKLAIVAKKGSGIKADKIDDLKGKVVGVVRGYDNTPEFDNYEGFERKDFSKDDRQLIKKFVNDRIPLIASSDEGVTKYLCKQAGVEIEDVYVLKATPGYIGFSRTLGEKGITLAEKFSQALRKLKEEGAVQKIESKYF